MMEDLDELLIKTTIYQRVICNSDCLNIYCGKHNTWFLGYYLVIAADEPDLSNIWKCVYGMEPLGLTGLLNDFVSMYSK